MASPPPPPAQPGPLAGPAVQRAATPCRSAATGWPQVSVCVRVRPLLPRDAPAESDAPGPSVVDVSEAEGELFVAWAKCFRFDHVFSGDTPQSGLFRQAVAASVDSLLTGHNATVLAYGQTGTGKTFTMGTQSVADHRDPLFHPDLQGLIPRTIQAVFEHFDRQALAPTIRISFFEILNEKVYDLLKVLKMRVPLKVKEAAHEFAIPDLTAEIVDSPAEAQRLLAQGCQIRSTGATGQNASSSRSHAIFRLTLVATNAAGQRVERKMDLVDLAGSESAARANPDVNRRTEGVNINKSLSVLGRCISAICDQDKHIPFRDSNLTKVLRECLTGTGHTTMIACISPAEADVKETMNTLRYADCVKRMEKPPIPPHLRQMAHLEKSAQKRRLPMIPPTPDGRGRLNHTIGTPTPRKRAHEENQRMNSTYGHGPMAAGEFATPIHPISRANYSHLSSTVAKAPSLETITDEDSISNVSSIEQCHTLASQSINSGVSSNMSLVDARSVFSPLMREMKQDLKRHIDETMKTWESSVRDTVSKSKRERTSSPRRSMRLFQVDKSLERPEPGDDQLMEETVISGLSFPEIRQKMRDQVECETDAILRKITTRELTTPLVDVTNRRSRHLRKVEATASPTLKGSDVNKENAMVVPTPKRGSRISSDAIPISIMEEKLGLTHGSPLLFEDDDLPYCGPKTSIRRSVRRTTMLHKELDQSLQHNKQREKKSVRRSIRLSERKVASPPVPLKHPLTQRNPWSVRNQSEHNDNILKLLNTANMGMLQRLPGIGPKTAIILHTQRELRGGYLSITDLNTIPGLQKNFFSKFLDKNQVIFS